MRTLALAAVAACIPMSIALAQLEGAPQTLRGSVATEDSNGAPYVGAVALAAGATAPSLANGAVYRGFGYICTTAGTITMTLADGSTIGPVGITADPRLQMFGFAVTSFTLASGAAGTFWVLK